MDIILDFRVYLFSLNLCFFYVFSPHLIFFPLFPLDNLFHISSLDFNCYHNLLIIFFHICSLNISYYHNHLIIFFHISSLNINYYHNLLIIFFTFLPISIWSLHIMFILLGWIYLHPLDRPNLYLTSSSNLISQLFGFYSQPMDSISYSVGNKLVTAINIWKIVLICDENVDFFHYSTISLYLLWR